jgi:hypothetical protein
VSIRLLNRHTRNPFRSCISRSTSQSHSLSDSISQRASLFTYHLVRAGYSPVPSSRFTLITAKTLDSSPTDYASSGSGSEHRIVTYAELATDPTQLKSSRACHRHVTRPHPIASMTTTPPSLLWDIMRALTARRALPATTGPPGRRPRVSRASVTAARGSVSRSPLWSRRKPWANNTARLATPA